MAQIKANNYSITVENINHTGVTQSVHAIKYLAMLAAILKTLPHQGQGFNQEEILLTVLPYLPEDLFPGGDKVGGWAKTVQLDLEEKNVQAWEKTTLLRWFQKF